MPCNFKCEESKKIFYQLKELAHQYNYEREWRWLEEGLNWEVKWDTLHGIGILVTPVSKTRFATSYTAEKKTVIKTGNSDTEHYKPWLWKDNGFADYQSMENLHAPIERIIYDLGDIGSIADLGCGNGYFLTKFDATAYGIDCNPEVIRRARNYFFKNNPENFVVGDITQFEFPDELDVAVIAAIRLIEMNKKDRMEFVAKMIEHTNHIVITGYNDWIEAYGGFKQLVEKTGFEISKFELMPDNNGGAAIVRWKG
jgi:SAM-dependent methyltransferase